MNEEGSQQWCERHAAMSKSREQRVDDALTQLIRLNFPGSSAESEDKAHELYGNACRRARGLLDGAIEESPNGEDTDHVAELIRRKRACILFYNRV